MMNNKAVHAPGQEMLDRLNQFGSDPDFEVLVDRLDHSDDLGELLAAFGETVPGHEQQWLDEFGDHAATIMQALRLAAVRQMKILVEVTASSVHDLVITVTENETVRLLHIVLAAQPQLTGASGRAAQA